MHIYGPAHLHGPQPIGPPHSSRVSRPGAAPDSPPIRDELEISDAARAAAQSEARGTCPVDGKAGRLPQIGHERVEAIRAQIAEGTYETPEKLEIAVERLLDAIG